MVKSRGTVTKRVSAVADGFANGDFPPSFGVHDPTAHCSPVQRRRCPNPAGPLRHSLQRGRGHSYAYSFWVRKETRVNVPQTPPPPFPDPLFSRSASRTAWGASSTPGERLTPLAEALITTRRAISFPPPGISTDPHDGPYVPAPRRGQNVGCKTSNEREWDTRRGNCRGGPSPSPFEGAALLRVDPSGWGCPVEPDGPPGLTD